MYKPQRHNRYSRLRDNGFLPQEAQVLSRVPAYVPYLKRMIIERRAEVKALQEQKIPKDKIVSTIRRSYKDNGYIKANGRLDVWAYLRRHEDDWRGKQPEYKSPSQKRRKNWVDFQRKFEKTKEKIELKRKAANEII